MKTFSALLLSALLSGSAAWILMDQRAEQPQRADSSVFASVSPGSNDKEEEAAPGGKARRLIAGILASGAAKGAPASEAVSTRAGAKTPRAQAGSVEGEAGALVADRVSGGASRYSAP
jgi:hypothetical protein